MKLIKKYRLGNTLIEEEPYWNETSEDFVNSLNPLKTSITETAPNWVEMGKFYTRNPNTIDATGGNRKANVVRADGKNPGYWNNPQVRANTGGNWRNTIGSELDKFLGIPYNFGGKESSYKAGITKDVGGKHPERKYSGVDCSGFVQWFAKDYLGIPLSEGATNEYNELVKRSGHNLILKQKGKLMNPTINEQTVLPGDVVFFGDKAGNHIGIVHHVKGEHIYLTNARGDDTAKIITCPIDDMVKNHSNVYITSLRSDRNYNLSQNPLQLINKGIQKSKQFFENITKSKK